MNYVDILLLIIVLLSVWGGMQNGFVYGMVNLVKWVGSILAGFFFYQYLAAYLDKYVPSLDVWNMPVAFILTVISARIVLALILNPLVRVTPAETHNSVFNRSLGIIPGLINGLIFATIVSALLLAFPIWDGLSSATRDSKIANKLATEVEWLDERASPVFDKAIRQTMNKLTVEPGSAETVTLPYTVENPRIRPDLEARMLDLVNAERTRQGLKSLQMDPELTRVARSHSRDMLARGYFSHYTPDGKDPFDRMRQAGVSFLAAGENLALAQTLSIAHNGLMNSPGHRANILRPAFGRVGIGILDAGIYGYMISQEFRN